VFLPGDDVVFDFSLGVELHGQGVGGAGLFKTTHRQGKLGRGDLGVGASVAEILSQTLESNCFRENLRELTSAVLGIQPSRSPYGGADGPTGIMAMLACFAIIFLRSLSRSQVGCDGAGKKLKHQTFL
jgi:hypothetical protein